MTNQILMAAARGARVQALYGYNNPVWQTAPLRVVLCGAQHRQRIHPDDEHLRFGPVSSALRERAVSPPNGLESIVLGIAYVDFTVSEWRNYQDYADDETKIWYLLMLAEELMWSGL